MAAIPTILKGDDSGSITLTMATGRTYTDATLIIAYQGVTRSFTNLTPGQTVTFAFTHDETAGFELGTKPILMRLIGQYGAEETVENAEARIKVTDCLAEVNAGGSFLVKPGEAGTDPTKVPITDVEDLASRYTMAQLAAKVNQIVHVLAQRSLLSVVAVCGTFAALADISVQTAQLDSLYNDSLVVTNVSGAATDPGVVSNIVEGYGFAYPTITNGLSTTAYVNQSCAETLASASNYTDRAVASATPGDYANVSNRAYSAYNTLTAKAGVWDAKQDAIADYTTTNAVRDIVSYKRDLTNNVCAADSFAYSAWSKENLPSGETWADQPTYDASIDLWEWSYDGGSAQSEEGGVDATSLTFGYGEGFTSTRTAIPVAISNDTFTTYIFVTNAIASATPDLSSRTTFAQATNIVASAAVTNEGAISWSRSNSLVGKRLEGVDPFNPWLDYFTPEMPRIILTNDSSVITLDPDFNQGIQLRLTDYPYARVSARPLNFSIAYGSAGASASIDGIHFQSYITGFGTTNFYMRFPGENWEYITNDDRIAVLGDIKRLSPNPDFTTNNTTLVGSVSCIASSASITNGGAKAYADALVAATNPTFSNQVLSVGLNIDTNSVAQLNAIVDGFGGFPIEGTATTVGGLLAALAAAIAWLKKKKIDKLTCPGVSDITTENGTANVSTLFSSANTSLMGVCRYETASKSGSDMAATTAFDSTATYAVGDYVLYNSTSYVCIAATTAGTLPTDTDYWAERTAKTAQMADRTTNAVTVTNATMNITFPAAVTDKMRDFLVYINATGYAAGGKFTVTLPTGADQYGDEFPEITATGEHLVAITEFASGKFYVKSIELEEVTA